MCGSHTDVKMRENWATVNLKETLPTSDQIVMYFVAQEPIFRDEVSILSSVQAHIDPIFAHFDVCAVQDSICVCIR